MASAKRNITSAISLISAFALGQGSLFLASTYLLLSGRSEIVTELGVAASLYSLVIWIADFGGVYYLSAYIKKHERDRIRAFFYGRLFCVLLGIALAYIARLVLGGEDGISGLFKYGTVLAALSCLGFGGAYDGIRRTSAVAIYASLPWVFSALSVLVVTDSNITSVSERVGLAFVIGHSVYVVRTIHLAYRLRFFGFPKRMRSVFHEINGALFYLISYAAGQSYARALLLAASGLLASPAAGLFVYIRQIYSAVSQVVLFLRRAEGVDSVRRPVVEVLFARSISGYVSIGLSFAMLIGAVVALFLNMLDVELAVLVASSAFCLLVWSYFNRLFFYFLGLSKLGVYLVLHSIAMFGLSFFVLQVSVASLAYYFPLIEAFVLLLEGTVLVAAALFIERRTVN